MRGSHRCPHLRHLHSVTVLTRSSYIFSLDLFSKNIYDDHIEIAARRKSAKEIKQFMTTFIDPATYGGNSEVDIKVLASHSGNILIRFNESTGARASIALTHEQLKALAGQIDDALFAIVASEPECSCVYVAADAVDARGCDAHSERRAA